MIESKKNIHFLQRIIHLCLFYLHITTCQILLSLSLEVAAPTWRFTFPFLHFLCTNLKRHSLEGNFRHTIVNMRCKITMALATWKLCQPVDNVKHMLKQCRSSKLNYSLPSHSPFNLTLRSSHTKLSILLPPTIPPTNKKLRSGRKREIFHHIFST